MAFMIFMKVATLLPVSKNIERTHLYDIHNLSQKNVIIKAQNWKTEWKSILWNPETHIGLGVT